MVETAECEDVSEMHRVLSDGSSIGASRTMYLDRRSVSFCIYAIVLH